MELSGKKVLIFAGPDFEDRELFYPLYRFREAGATVKIVCADFVKETWDAVVIPGGWAPDKIRANSEALEIVRKTLKDGNVVASICHGGWVLSSADVVKGKTVTSFANIKHDLIHAGATWVDQEVVVDSGLVTSRKPDDLPAFCREVIKLMQKAKVPA